MSKSKIGLVERYLLNGACLSKAVRGLGAAGPRENFAVLDASSRYFFLARTKNVKIFRALDFFRAQKSSTGRFRGLLFFPRGGVPPKKLNKKR